MLKNENYGIFADLMLSDIMNERKHLLFYITAASTVSGPHREEYKELFEKEAAGEMQHVIQFQNVLLGLGVDLTASTKTIEHNPYIVSYDVKELLTFALKMEEEVVANYASRICNDLNLLDDPDRRYLEIFYEDQIKKSREDVDNYRMILRNFT
jgi:bacterioferritin (cytochrome b1)